METFSFTGTSFGDDEAIVDVCLFKGAAYDSHYLFPFGEEQQMAQYAREISYRLLKLNRNQSLNHKRKNL